MRGQLCGQNALGEQCSPCFSHSGACFLPCSVDTAWVFSSAIQGNQHQEMGVHQLSTSKEEEKGRY